MTSVFSGEELKRTACCIDNDTSNVTSSIVFILLNYILYGRSSK